MITDEDRKYIELKYLIKADRINHQYLEKKQEIQRVAGSRGQIRSGPTNRLLQENEAERLHSLIQCRRELFLNAHRKNNKRITEEETEDIRHDLKKMAEDWPMRDRLSAAWKKELETRVYEVNSEIEQQPKIPEITVSEKLEQRDKLDREIKAAVRSEAAVNIDIVESTKLKDDEKPDKIQLVFNRYYEFRKNLVAKHDGSVFTEAGDGAILFFKKAVTALTFCNALIEQIGEFNEKENKLKGAFRIRIGCAFGEYLEDETRPSGQVASQCIDHACHLQGSALPNEIRITDAFYQELPKELRAGFKKEYFQKDKINIWVLSVKVQEGADINGKSGKDHTEADSPITLKIKEERGGMLWLMISNTGDHTYPINEIGFELLDDRCLKHQTDWGGTPFTYPIKIEPHNTVKIHIGIQPVFRDLKRRYGAGKTDSELRSIVLTSYAWNEADQAIFRGDGLQFPRRLEDLFYEYEKARKVKEKAALDSIADESEEASEALTHAQKTLKKTAMPLVANMLRVWKYDFMHRHFFETAVHGEKHLEDIVRQRNENKNNFYALWNKLREPIKNLAGASESEIDEIRRYRNYLIEEATEIAVWFLEEMQETQKKLGGKPGLDEFMKVYGKEPAETLGNA